MSPAPSQPPTAGPARPRRQLSIRWIVAIPFALQVTAAVALTGWLSLRHGQHAVNELSGRLRAEMMTQIESHLTARLNQPHDINQRNADAIRLGQLDPSDPLALNRHFWLQAQRHEVAHIYFGNTQGGLAGAGPREDGTLSLTRTDEFRAGPFQVFAADERGRPGALLRLNPEQYDARQRPWYRAAIQAGDATWGQVILSFNNGELNLSPSLPVYDAAGLLQGVLGVDIQLAQLGDFLRELHLTPNGKVYVVDAAGQLIASSAPQTPLTNEADKEIWLRAADSEEPLIRATDRFLRDRYGSYPAIATSQQLSFQHQGKRQFIQVTPLRDPRGLEWWIAIAIPEQDFAAEIQKNRRTTIWLCAGALVLSILTGLATAQGLMRPLASLRQATHDISSGAFDRRVPSFAFSELSDLAAAFNAMTEQLQATFRDLAQRQVKLAEAQQIAHVGSWELLLPQRQLTGSAELWRMVGYAQPLPGLSLSAAWRRLWCPACSQTWRQVRARIASEPDFELETRLQRPNGDRRQIYIVGRVERDSRGQVTRLYGTVMDVTKQRQAEAALREAEANYRSLFENAIEGIFCIDPAGQYFNINPAFADLYGYSSPEQLLAAQNERVQQFVEPQRYRDWLAALHASDRLEGFEAEVYRADGSRIWISENVRAVRDADGRLLHYEGSVENITRRRQVEAQLRYSAAYDPLTCLPNRTAFMEGLQAAIARSESNPEFQFAVLFLDLDRFKLVNDSLGHLLGDRLLVLMAESLRACLGLDNELPDSLLAIGESEAPIPSLLARFGGDEFIILLAEIEGVHTATMVAEQILQTLRSPFDLEGNTVFANTSIGIALSRTGGGRPETFLRNADIALYRAKARGGSSYEVFNTVMHAQAVGRLQLENDLRNSLANDELLLYYQPIVAVATRRIVGFEALVRWPRPFEGFMSPAKFIPVAEETGLIIPLGQWVLTRACQQMQAWLQQFPHSYMLSMGVNLSGRQFAQPNLLSQIAYVLETTNLPPQNLRLELTESTLMDKAQTSNTILKRLSDLGIRLSVDDFGTGYSSLSYLYRFPLNTLKIDRSFVRRLGEQDESLEIVAAIVTLAHSLGMDIVAEGVETEIQFHCLHSLGCEQVQGYLFAPPLPAEQATALLANAPAFAELF